MAVALRELGLGRPFLRGLAAESSAAPLAAPAGASSVAAGLAATATELSYVALTETRSAIDSTPLPPPARADPAPCVPPWADQRNTRRGRARAASLIRPGQRGGVTAVMDVYRNRYLGPLGRGVGQRPPLPERKWEHRWVAWLYSSKHLDRRAGSKGVAMSFSGAGHCWPRRGRGLVANHPREGWPKLAMLDTGMNGDSGVGTPAPSLESVQELRLLVLLHDLVRQEGRTGAAGCWGSTARRWRQR